MAAATQVYDDASVSSSLVSVALEVLPSRSPPVLAPPVPFCVGAVPPGAAPPGGWPPNPPPKPPAAAGPALGIAPEWGVAAVAREYAAGPARPAITAAAATAQATRAGR